MTDVEKEKPEKEEKSAELEEQLIYLPSIVASIYATPVTEAEKIIATGQVFIDGKQTAGKSLYEYSRSQIEGKTIEIKSTPRSVKFLCDLENMSEYREGVTE